MHIYVFFTLGYMSINTEGELHGPVYDVFALHCTQRKYSLIPGGTIINDTSVAQMDLDMETVICVPETIGNK